MRPPRLAAVLTAIVLLPTAAGCSRVFGCAPSPPDDITVSDLAGVYTGAEGARIDLQADGHFSARNVPGFAGGSHEGTWTLDLASETTEDMRLDDVQLWISGERDEPWLFQFDGDPDNCELVTFQRDS